MGTKYEWTFRDLFLFDVRTLFLKSLRQTIQNFRRPIIRLLAEIGMRDIEKSLVSSVRSAYGFRSYDFKTLYVRN
jgi:hypothetical protein